MLCRYQFLSITLLLVAHTKTSEKMDRILTEERFLLFSQRCILRNTADLLHFMLHRVLSVTSVKKVCCEKRYSSHIERRIDVWQLSVVHLATNYNTHCLLIFLFKISWYQRGQKISSFSPNLTNKIKIRAWKKSFRICQILI